MATLISRIALREVVCVFMFALVGFLMCSIYSLIQQVLTHPCARFPQEGAANLL